MICTRNGVLATLEEYGDARIADAYVVGGMLILRTTAQPIRSGYHHSGPRVTVDRIHHWFDERRNYGVMIVLAGDWSGEL